MRIQVPRRERGPAQLHVEGFVERLLCIDQEPSMKLLLFLGLSSDGVPAMAPSSRGILTTIRLS